MTVLIDPPLWPRHGRLWGHLVSDASLEELHELAARAGIPRRGFDLDHYDVPAEAYPELLRHGARAVDSRELVRRLRASGLRVPARDRNRAALRHPSSPSAAVPSSSLVRPASTDDDGGHPREEVPAVVSFGGAT